MSAIALALYAVFVFLAFGWRSWLQYRRTGDHGFRGFHARPGSAGWWGGALLALGCVAAGVAPLTDLAGVLPRVVLPSPAAGLGLATLCAGLALTLLAQLQMGPSWRIGVDETERTELVTRGLFGLVRNPIFTAMLSSLLGLALAVPNALAWLALATALLGVELHVRRVEEPYLARLHGERYRDYALRVGRFVPGIGRLS